MYDIKSTEVEISDYQIAVRGPQRDWAPFVVDAINFAAITEEKEDVEV